VRIATTCQLGIERGTNHFHDEHLFIETRDVASGELRDEGEAEVILSTSYREASPVIRFALRDKVELVPAGACPCGDPRPGFRPGSVGRIDSMLKIRGVNFWPQQVEQLLLSHPLVRDFRGEVQRRADGADELLLRVSVRPQAAGDVAQLLQELVRERTMVRPRIILDDAIDEAQGVYKVRRWADRRKSAPLPG